LDNEITLIVKKALTVLTSTKEKLLDIFEKCGYDPAYFNVNIDLKFVVDDKTVRVHEKWKGLPP